MNRFNRWCTQLGNTVSAGTGFDHLWRTIGLGTSQRGAARQRRSRQSWCLQSSETLEERLVLTPAVSVEVAPLQVEEDVGNTLFFTFTRTETAGALSVNFGVSGSAAFGTDYTQSGATTFTLATGTVAFTDGADTATVTVNVTTDDNTEPDETVILTVTSGAGYTIGAIPAATGTIINDDSLVSIAADAVSQAEGNINNTAFTFTVTRTGDTTDSDTVGYVVTGSGTNPATAADFGGSFPSGTVPFAQGVTIQTVTINVSGDMLAEADEGFTVTLQNPSAHLFIGTGSASTTITNDDPILTLSSLTVDENLAIGTVVGTFDIPIPGVTGTPVFTLVAGVGDTNNASFSIVGNQLRTAESFNFEAKSIYSIRVHGQDAGSITTDRVFTINVNDANDPTILSLGAATPVTFTKKPIFVFQTLTVQDPDSASGFRLGGGQLTLTMNTVLNSKGKSLDILKLVKPLSLGTTEGLDIVGNTVQLHISLSQSSFVDQIQSFLRSITFKTKKPGLSVAQRMLQLQLTDSASQTVGVTQTINVGM